VIKDRGASADLAGATEALEATGRQDELLARVDARPKVELDEPLFDGADMGMVRVGAEQDDPEAILEVDALVETFGCMPCRLGGRTLLLDEDEAVEDADKGRCGGPIIPTLLLKIESSLHRTAKVLLLSLYGIMVSAAGTAGRGFRTLLLLSASGAMSPRI
jgi:hypothetical protein